MSYTLLSQNDQVQLKETVTISTWTGNQNNLNLHFTGSPGTVDEQLFNSPTSSANFYLNVFQTASTDDTAEVQYSVAYGNRKGSGSPDFTNDTGSFGLSATRTNYSQYRQLHFNDDTKNFTFGTHTPDKPSPIYIININRARYKQKLTLGSLNLHISGTTAGFISESQSTIHLTDDSAVNEALGTSISLGPFFSIVSGADGVPHTVSGSATTTAVTQVGGSSSYGHYYPEAGLILLNGDAFAGALKPTLSTDTGTAITDKNHEVLLRHISKSTVDASTGYFIVDSTEEINSEFYFCRARNDQFNYTNNESFVDANKNIFHESMKLNPKVFITTVGLYNDAYELLALAKLSQPVAKDFTKEALIRVKLDF